MGQSNIPAGATIGSNHNSRSADGEFIAGRGFWPGLCVSIKHNTKLASFTILAKGDYAYEMNIPVPFSLVSVDAAKDRLVVMPAYWFLYNMYALARNSWKYADRDKRKEKIQFLENDYLAPDSVNEMFNAISLFETATGVAYYKHTNSEILPTDDECRQKGKGLLKEKNDIVHELNIVVPGFENAKRKTVLIKVQQAYDAFKSMIFYYGISQLTLLLDGCLETGTDWKDCIHQNKRNNWLNIGGQLMPEEEVYQLKKDIKEDNINGWHDVHRWYYLQGEAYPQQKRQHALASLAEIREINLDGVSVGDIVQWLDEAVEIRKQMVAAIHFSRAKDYTNPFRKMTYESEQEMEKVLGKLDDNSFVKQQQQELTLFVETIASLQAKLTAKPSQVPH